MITGLLVAILLLVVLASGLTFAQYRATGGTPIWVVAAYNEDEEPVRRNVTAPDEEAVTAILRHQRLKVDQMRMIPIWRRIFRRDLQLSEFRKKVPSRQVSDMAHTIFTFISSSVPIQEAIAIYARQKPDNMCRGIMRRIQADISGGRLRVQEAFASYADQLGPEVVAMIAAGMTAAEGMGAAFEQIAELSEKRDNITRQWRKAMIYPAIVLSLTVVALAIMLWAVVPKFKAAFASFNAKLPAPTQITVDLSRLLFSHFYVPILLVLGVVVGVGYLRSNEQTRLQWDRIATRLPLMGRVIESASLGRAMATLSGLLAVGIPTQEALRLATPAAGNKWMEKVLGEVGAALGQSTIQEAVRAHEDDLPKNLVSFIETGAATADLDSVLRRYAKFAQRDADLAVEKMSSTIEPLMIVVLGLVIGAIVVTLYLPMVDIIKVIK